MVIKGAKEIEMALRDLPEAIRVSAIRATARKASKPVIRAIRQEIKSTIPFSQDGQSKAAYVARNVRAVTLRSKISPGVYVGVKGKDIQVGDRSWDVRAYAILLGEGAYKAGVRKTRKGRKSTGRFRGFENFIENGAEKAGNAPGNIMLGEIDKEVEKAIDRLTRKYG